MSDIDEFNLSDLEEDLEDVGLDSEWDLEPEPDVVANPDQPHIPPHSEAQYTAVKAVVDCLMAHKLRLDDFIHAICYGNQSCISDTSMKECQRQLTSSPLLSTILNNLHTPSHYTGGPPKAASAMLDQWAWQHVTRIARKELDQLAGDVYTRSKQRQESDPEEECDPERKESDPEEECDPGRKESNPEEEGNPERKESSQDFENIDFDSFRDKTLVLCPALVRFLTLAGESNPKARARRNDNPMDSEEIIPSYAAVMNVHLLAFQFSPCFSHRLRHSEHKYEVAAQTQLHDQVFA